MSESILKNKSYLFETDEKRLNQNIVAMLVSTFKKIKK